MELGAEGEDGPTPGAQGTWRALYSRAADAEALLPQEMVPEIRAELGRLATATATASGTTMPDDLTELSEQTRAWTRAESERFQRVFATADENEGKIGAAVLIRRAALHCAPLALASGAWLQWLSAPGNAEDPTTLSILKLYASDIDVGHPHAARGSAYLALLRHMKLSENVVPLGRLSREQRIADGSFYLPAMLLTMSRLPDDLSEEILGADLCLRAIGLLPALTVARSALPTAVDWTALDPGTPRRPDLPGGWSQCRQAVEMSPGGDKATRVLAGFQWALAAVRRWSEQVLADLDAARDPGYEIAELLRFRAREGAIYHQNFELEGRALADWMREARTDPTPLLTVLAKSRLVKPGQADRSPLVNGLVGERGSMFRIFAPEDLAAIRRWIDALPKDGDGAGQVPARPAAPAYLPALDVRPAKGSGPTGIREAYHMLMSRTDQLALRHWARAYVEGWLARARHDILHREMPLPERWTSDGLRPWLLDQHDRHSQEFEKDDTPVPSRHALIDSTVQLAPLTLIDGSWIQGFTDYEHASSEIGHSLFDTYWDELGNGEPRLNHPLIYREVLTEMGVEPPPTGSQEFAEWPRFRDVSFELPVYWLSIGRFPQTYLPEVLGLNLAMELSGVGGTYRRAHIALKAHGFSTRFVDIHNTIDNVASGHSAWAADAIDTYMATLPHSQGSRARASAWERVRVGYRSLNPPSGRRARAAAKRTMRKALRQSTHEPSRTGAGR